MIAKLKSLLRVLPLLALVLFAHAAHAELQFCVSTTAQLKQALQDAKDQEQAASIRLVQGTYDDVTSNGLSGFFAYPDRLAIYGGYGPNCSTRILDPTNTVLNFRDKFTTFEFLDGVTDDVVLEGLTFGTPFWMDLDISAHAVFVRNNTFKQGIHFSCLPGCSSVAMVFENNRISGIAAAQQLDGCALFIGNTDGLETLADLDVYLINNTIAGNVLGGSFNAGVCLNTRARVALYNNIFYNNSGVDLHNLDQAPVNDPPWLLVDNTIGSSSNLPGLDAASTGTSSANPLFVNGASDFHLQNASPAINSGEPNPLFGLTRLDLDGNPRVVGTRPDRGAYESNVDDAPGIVIPVTSNADSGAGTLRQAIVNANAAGGSHIISFNLPGACPQMIALSTPLNALTSNVALLGYSQPGSAPNTAERGDNAVRCVILDGHSISNASSYGLRANGNASSFLRLEGLAFEGFKQAAVQLLSGKAHTLTGNQFGGSVGGVALSANAVDILIVGSSAGSTIGGPNPAQRNVIGGATIEGIGILHSNVDNSVGNTILGNLIGTTPDGNGAAPNTVGILVQTKANFIASNTLSGNLLFGAQFDGTNATANIAIDNLVGIKGGVYVNLPGFDPSLPNSAGVTFSNGAANNLVSANTIAYNSGDGVSMFTGAGLGNRLTTNRIYRNGQYGIDLAGGNTADNDADPNAQTLPNRGLNAPAILALGGKRSGLFVGSVSSTVGTYLIQYFWNPSCPANGLAQGQIPIGSVPLTIASAPSGQNGFASVQANLYSPVGLIGGGISATATDAQGNTSTFSPCTLFQNDEIFAVGFE
jgi:hypothetical protein